MKTILALVVSLLRGWKHGDLIERVPRTRDGSCTRVGDDRSHMQSESVWPTIWRRFLFLSDAGAELRIDRIRRELSAPSIHSFDPEDGRYLLGCLDTAIREISAKTEEISALKTRNADLLSLAKSLSPGNPTAILYD